LDSAKFSKKACTNGHLTLTPKPHNIVIVGTKAQKAIT